jgi:hypothetical protein
MVKTETGFHRGSLMGINGARKKRWGIEDIFAAITRSETARTALWLGLQGLEQIPVDVGHRL